ncbi:MAG: hypothetical protein ACSLFI_12865 [Solirubrobacterales bacterium]
MPTKLRRIAVTEDPELAEVLVRAALVLPGRSSAALLKELALRGADSLESGADSNPKLQRVLAMPGVRPASGTFKDFLRERGEIEIPAGAGPYRGTKALEQEREERS